MNLRNRRSWFGWGLSLILLILCARVVSAGSVPNLVTEDSWISGLGSGVVEGAGTSLSICPTANYWIYLKFDLSSVQGTVTNAELRMTRFGGSRPDEIASYFITDDSWTKATMTGANRPNPMNPMNAESLGTGVDTGSFDRWNSVALTAAVAQEAAGDETITLMVREDPSGSVDVRNYFSKEAAQPDSVKPQLVLGVDPETIDSNWLVSDVADGTKPSFDFDSSDRIHIMGMTEDFGGGVWYAVADAMFGPWSPTTVSNGYFYGPGDIRVDASDAAHIAFHNHSVSGGTPAHAVIHPGGMVEGYEIDTPSLHDGWDNSLALSPSGTVRQACINPSAFGATDSLQYGTFTGSGWTFESSVPGSGAVMYGLNTSLAIDQSGSPHIMYCGATDWYVPGDLMYAEKTSGSWAISSVVTGGIRGRFPSMALDHWDRPHVAWLDIDEVDNTMGTVRYAVFNAGTWDVEDIDTLTDVLLGFGDARKSVSLELDSGWRPRVAYSDQKIIKYAEKPFGTWNITTVLQHTELTYKSLVVLRLDSADRPGIVFWEPASGNSGLIRLLRPKPTTFDFDIGEPAPSSQVVLNWTPGVDGYDYTVQARVGGADAWINEPGVWPIASTVWTVNTATAASKDYRILATPR